MPGRKASVHRQSKKMRYFSTLAGAYAKIGPRNRYTVQYRNLQSFDKKAYQSWTKIIAYGTLLTVCIFALIVFRPSQWITTEHPDAATSDFSWIMLACLFILQVFLILGTYAATRATLKAKNPIPVRPQHGLRVAFVTTRAPGEPVEMVIKTLEAMVRVRYKNGLKDVWLLDETKDKALKRVCRKLGVRYFSRKNIDKWNMVPVQKSLRYRLKHTLLRIVSLKKQSALRQDFNPIYAAKSKHGNFNAWLAYLKKKGLIYDILAGVDTDHVPEVNFLERLLGYFRDKDVAYVVGPQVYGNYTNGYTGLVARCAESQASFFQSTIQRAGNATKSPMFVGTNYAIRLSALRQIGGFQPCITEDMATGLSILAKRNSDTGKRWKSVYTPDVLAIGEGPSTWGPFFTQQWRWAAGTFDTWRKIVWKKFFRLSPGSMLHYFLMLMFYPIGALTWLLSMISSTTYFLTGATAVGAPWNQFVSLYLMSVVMQLSLYVWNRRFNVSPHEPEGSYGIPGILMTTLTTPIYLSALMSIATGKKPNFVVTAKGQQSAGDKPQAFRSHIKWALLLSLVIIIGFFRGHDNPAMLVWADMQLLICIAPIALGLVPLLQYRIQKTPLIREPLPSTRRITPHA